MSEEFFFARQVLNFVIKIGHCLPEQDMGRLGLGSVDVMVYGRTFPVMLEGAVY